MKIQVCILLLMVVGATSINTKCPFDHIYQFGDAVTDIGNTNYVLPWGQIAASTRPPYGIDYPGNPTGRWSNGRVDFDYTAVGFGLPNVVPYLGMDPSGSYDGVVFSVAGSPVLDLSFFESRGIDIPPYAHAPLSTQINWFKTYLKYAVCSTQAECTSWLEGSLVAFSDVHANDVGYALTQNKTIEEVQTYEPLIIETIINNTRDLINMGASRVIVAGNGPIGCYPYILTELATDDPTAYDELGCLKSVNDFISSRNSQLEDAVSDLRDEFPQAQIFYGDVFNVNLMFINQSTVIGPDGVNKALKACCGIGGKYNYDKNRFCGSPEAQICSNRSEYIFWDGLGATEQGYLNPQQFLIAQAYVTLNCTTGSSAASK